MPLTGETLTLGDALDLLMDAAKADPDASDAEVSACRNFRALMGAGLAEYVDHRLSDTAAHLRAALALAAKSGGSE